MEASRSHLNAPDLESEGLRALAETLGEVPFLRAGRPVRSGKPDRADFEIKVRWPGGETTLLCEVRRNGQPSPARDALAQLEHWVAQRPGSTGVLIAPYISPDVAQMCAERGIAAIDLSGNARLTVGNIYIHRAGKPNRFTERQEMRSIFAPKASRVLRVLIENPGHVWTTQALAEEAKVSAGQVSQVKQSLHASDWLVEGHGVRLSRPEDTLRTWGVHQGRVELERVEFHTTKPLERAQEDLLWLFPKAGRHFGLCGQSAAWVYAPMVKPLRVSMYVDWSPREDWIQRDAFLKEVPSGGNVVLIRPRDEGVFYWKPGASPNKLSIVGVVQTYLDCVRSGGRGEEAAAAVLEQRLRPAW